MISARPPKSAHGPRALLRIALQPTEILGGGGLLAMPRLRDVLNPWLTDVAHQHESQSVCVWPAELIHARAFAIFGNRPFPASLLNCHGLAGNRIGAPDLCLWLCSCNVKRTVGIDRPDRAQRVGPLPDERVRAGDRDGFACSNHCYQDDCKKNSESVLSLHACNRDSRPPKPSRLERSKSYVANNFVTEVEEDRGSTVDAACHTRTKLVEAKLEMVRAARVFHCGAAVSGVRWINSRDRLQRDEIDRRLQGGIGSRQGGFRCGSSSRFTYQGRISPLGKHKCERRVW
jgi:hypothetical protein